MKKIILLFTVLAALHSFSATYEVSQNKGVKISKEAVGKNNIGIENAVKKEMTENYIVTKAEIDDAKKNTIDPLTEGELFIDIENTDDALFSYRYTQTALMDVYDKINNGYEIKKINYTSPEKAEVTVILKGPDIKSLNEGNINRKAEELFKAKMGYTIKEAGNRKWKAKEEVAAITELYKITVKVLAEDLSSLKDTDKREVLIHLNRKNNLWEVDYK